MISDKKISFIFKLLNEDYVNLIPVEAAGLYLRLMWMKQQILDGMKSKNNPSISFDDIISNTNMSYKSFENHIKILDAIGFVSILKIKSSLSVENPKELSYEEHVKLIENLVEKSIIEPEKKQSYIDNIRDHEENKKQRKIASMQPRDYDFGDAEIRKPDSPTNIVKYYYKKLSEAFGGKFTSYNLPREAHVIDSHMKRWGDSADVTRKMFDYMIDRAKDSNKFEQVSSMALYGCRRNNIHYQVFGQKQQDTQPLSMHEEKMNNMKILYDLYVEEGMSQTEAKEELRDAFGDKTLQQFEERLNGEKILIH